VYSFSSSWKNAPETSESTARNATYRWSSSQRRPRLRGRAGRLAVEAAHEGTGLVGAIPVSFREYAVDLDWGACPVHDVLAAGAAAGGQEQQEWDHPHGPRITAE